MKIWQSAAFNTPPIPDLAAWQRLCLPLLAAFALGQGALAAPPVRISVIPASGSGIEQDIVDRITMSLNNNNEATVSTVNPDWIVVCNIVENNNQVNGQVRYNGNVTIKTKSGRVLDNVSVQRYKQDYSMQPGAPLNKALVDSAARDVITVASGRALTAITNAVSLEIATRDSIIKAVELAQTDNYDGAIGYLESVSADSPHFDDVQKLKDKFALENHCLHLMNQAKADAKASKLIAAIGKLSQISETSKRYSEATTMLADLKAKEVAKERHRAK